MNEEYSFIPESIGESSIRFNVDTDKDTIENQIKKRYEEDTEHRGKLVKWVVSVSNLWLIFVGSVVLLDAGPFHFNVSDGVIIALLGTATANVLGLPYVVLKGLF